MVNAAGCLDTGPLNFFGLVGVLEESVKESSTMLLVELLYPLMTIAAFG